MATVSVKQFHPEGVLEFAQAMTDGRRRQPQRLGRGGNPATLDDSHESFEVCYAIHSKIPKDAFDLQQVAPRSSRGYRAGVPMHRPCWFDMERI